MQPSAPPAWYPDPQQPGQYRWFDGSVWTAHTAAVQPPPDAVPGWLMPVNIAWQAVAAGYVGLFGLVVVVLFPFSLGLGIWGLRVIGKGTAKGRGRCWFAIASGVWNLVFFGLVLASYE